MNNELNTIKKINKIKILKREEIKSIKVSLRLGQ